MTDLAERLTRTERQQTSANQRPRDAATLILLDRSQGAPKVLMGRRHPGHKFMPGKFVFPGGRLDPSDTRMASAGDLPQSSARRLGEMVVRPRRDLARCLALTAIRETFEETGLLLGRKAQVGSGVPEAWAGFARAGVLPDLSQVTFVARAITPPRRPKRFDTRFFVADISAVADRIDGVVGPDTELVELKTVALTQARELDLPTITQVVLEELEKWLAETEADPAVPFYRMMHGKFVRHLL
jgi:8-oxo-dGTP pyrophosphatase MutT (NUDIX family)